jgi:hypothetical protein
VPRVPFRIALFLSSFAPLFALMAFVNRCTPVALAILLGACLVGILGLILVLHLLSSEEGPAITVRRAIPKDGEVLSYIAAYLLPFLAVDLTNINDTVLFCGFLFVLCVVYVNSNMLFVNPLLSLAGFHTFEVTDARDSVFTVLTRQRDFADGVTIRPAQVDRHLRVDAHWQRERSDETAGGA